MAKKVKKKEKPDDAAEEEPAEDEGQGIDEDTAKMLDEQVKKGKERKFIVMYKGANIRKLVVFRKGTYKSKIQQAKKEGFRGTPLCGTITGSGMAVTFRLPGNKQVSGAMGVENVVTDEPIKTNLLKRFFADNNLKRKPEFEIVSSVDQLKKPQAKKSPGPKSPAGGAGAGQATA
jgi:hypothetical protein